MSQAEDGSWECCRGHDDCDNHIAINSWLVKVILMKLCYQVIMDTAMNLGCLNCVDVAWFIMIVFALVFSYIVKRIVCQLFETDIIKYLIIFKYLES